MNTFSKRLLLLSIITFLSACGGDGDSASTPSATTYSGITTPATLSTDNAKPLSGASTEASKTAGTADAFKIFKTGASSISADDKSTDLDSIVKKAAQLALSYATDDVPGICSSGSVVVEGIDPNADQYGYFDLTVKFTQCTVVNNTPEFKLNGTARFQGYIFGNFTLTYTNFTVTHDGVVETINLSISCTTGSCTVSTDFKGNDGRVYRVENLTVSGYSSITINGRVYHPDHGYINITTLSPIFFNCANEIPSSGEIQFTDNSNTVTVTYNSCTSYTVTFNNGTTVTPTMYNW